MVLKQEPYYWVECNRCGERAAYHGGEISAWPDAGLAIDCATECLDWTTDGTRHHCPDCPPLSEHDDEE